MAKAPLLHTVKAREIRGGSGLAGMWHGIRPGLGVPSRCPNGPSGMLRGNALARVDEKGRLKLPAAFRSYIVPNYGTDLFVTSLRGESVRIYPLPVYARVEERLLGASAVKPAVTKLRSLLNYYGQPASLDGQGRVLIHPLVREKAEIAGNVAVLGQIDYLEVWNRTAFERRMDMEPLTDDDLKELASLGF